MLKLSCSLDHNGVPCVSASQLEEYAESLIEEYNPRLNREPQAMDIELFAERYLGANLEIRPLTANRSILGVTVFHGGCIPVYDRMKGSLVPLNVCERTIMVEQGLLNTREPGRFNFTVAHEAGHLACHSDVHIESGMIHRFDSGSTVILCRETGAGKYRRRTPEDWLEWQADYMGGALLMPRKAFCMAVDTALMRLGRFSGPLGWKTMKQESQLRNMVIAYVADVFKTSQMATSIRLQELEAQKVLVR